MKPAPLKVIAGTPDKPLVIDDIKIDCYVLEDETRVLSQRGMIREIGVRAGGGSSGSSTKTPRFFTSKLLKPFIPQEVAELLESSVEFFSPPSNIRTFGYPATILPSLCDIIIRADDAGQLTSQQKHIVQHCRILVMGFAQIGIIGLVDETSGYQAIRERNALATILEKYIAQEWHEWTKTFPDEFYKQIFRLKGWGSVDGIQRPSVIGKYTNDIVYDRLAPGVLKELRKLNPKYPSGRRKRTHHQWFTPDFGHPKLKAHLEGVTALMKISTNWEQFKRHLRKAYPKIGDQTSLPLEEED